MKLYCLCGCLFFMAFFGFSQTPDIFRVEYTLIPENSAEVQLSIAKLVTNIPIRLKDSSNIVIGGEYNRIAYEINRNVDFDNTGLNLFHVVDLNMAYVLKYNKEWRFIGVVTPRLASTFDNPLENGDFSVNTTIGVFRDRPKRDKPNRLVLGLTYNSSVAFRIPLPIVYFEKRFHPNWSYVLGVPKTGVKYHAGKRHTFKGEFVLDGYFVNLQNNVLVSETSLASSISSSAALITLGYQFNISKLVGLYLYAGHTLLNSGVLRDEERNDIFTLNDESSFYFRTGFRIGL